MNYTGHNAVSIKGYDEEKEVRGKPREQNRKKGRNKERQEHVKKLLIYYLQFMEQ
jgi:hypothetical protein